jgi:hypothetical protein
MNTKLHGLLYARASPHWRMPGAERTMCRLLMGSGILLSIDTIRLYVRLFCVAVKYQPPVLQCKVSSYNRPGVGKRASEPQSR